MAVRKPLVRIAGKIVQLPDADSLTGVIPFTAFDTAPTGVPDGWRWLDTDEGIEYVWYDSTWATYSPPGPQGEQGDQGEPGAGFPVGGVTGSGLHKVSGTDFDTTWAPDSWDTAGRPGTPWTGQRGLNTTLGCNETWDGTYWVQEGLQSSGPITLTGSSVDITGIPPWAKKLSIELFDCASTSTSTYTIQLGTSGGMVSTGYKTTTVRLTSGSTSTSSNESSGFVVTAGSGDALNGPLRLERSGASLWGGQGIFSRLSAALPFSVGTVDIGGAITQARIIRSAGTWSGTAYAHWSA